MFRAFFILLALINPIFFLLAANSTQNAEQLNNQAYIFFTTGDYKNAKKTVTQAYQLAIENKDTVQIFFSLIGQMNLASLNYNYTEYEKLITQARNLGLSPSQKKMLESYQAIFFEATGQNKKALESALLFFQLTNPKDTIETIVALNNIGSIYLEKGDYTLARNYLQKAISLAQKKDSKKLIICLKNLASTYITSRPQKALQLYESAINLTEDKMHLQSIYYAQAQIHSKLKNLIKAKKLFEKAYQINKNRGADIYFSGIAQIYAQNKKHQLAIEQLTKAEAFLDKKDRNPLSIDRYYLKLLIAENYLALNQTESTIKKIDQAIDLLTIDYTPSNQFDLPKTENVISLVDFLEALDVKAQAQKLLLNTNESKVELLKYYKYINNAINQIRVEYQTEESKYALANNIQQYYKHSMQLCLDLYSSTKNTDFINQAFEFAENNKAVVLLDAIKDNDAMQFGGLTETDREEERALKIDLAFYQKEYSNALKQNDTLRKNNLLNTLIKTREDYQKFKEKLEKNYPDYYALKYAQNQISIPILQNQILKNQQLIAYTQINPTNFIGFCVSKKSVKMQSLTIAPSLLDSLKNMATYNGVLDWEDDVQGFTKKYNNIAYKIYDSLLAPLDINNNQSLIFVQDGILNGLPMGLLVCSSFNQQQSIGELDYLAKNAPISYANSAALYIKSLQHPNKNNNNGILAFAATYNQNSTKQHYKPVYSKPRQRNNPLVPITGTLTELELLQSHFKGSYFIDTLAVEKTFKKQVSKHPIIHLAMHGILDDTDPKNSHLVFTLGNQNKEDNILYPFEISTLKLNADLVVLSACKTGIGKNQKGEGLISLSRSFSYAGAKSLLTTLWNINDALTPTFVEQFYTDLKNGKTKAEALQNCRISCMNNIWEHPYYWGAFVLYGNPQTIEIPTKTNYPYLTIILSTLTLILIGGLTYKIKNKR